MIYNVLTLADGTIRVAVSTPSGARFRYFSSRLSANIYTWWLRTRYRAQARY